MDKEEKYEEALKFAKMLVKKGKSRGNSGVLSCRRMGKIRGNYEFRYFHV